MKEYLKKWNNIRLRNKIIILFILSLFLPIMIIFSTSYVNLKNSTKERYLHYNQLLFENAIEEVNNILEGIYGVKYDFIMDNMFITYLLNVRALYLDTQSNESSFFYILNRMNEIIGKNKYVQSMQVINNINEMYFFSKLQGDIPYSIHNLVQNNFLSEISMKSGLYVNYGYDKGRNVYVAGCRIFSKEKLQEAGTLIISFSLDFVKEIENKYNLNEGIFCIYDRKNKNLIYSNNDKLLRTLNITFKPIRNINNEKRSKYTILSQSVNNDDWELIYILPENILMSNFAYIKRLLIIMFCMLLAFSLFLIFLISESITLPIQKLNIQIQQVKKGNWDIDRYIEQDDEIGDLAKNFYDMINKINNLVVKVYQEEIARKNAEINALLMQLNPHFLYNTLDTINALAELNRTKDIALMAVSLAKFLRMSLSLKEPVATISQEVDYITHYLTIMKIRFNHNLEYKIKIEEELKNTYVPRQLLLPFVENSIVHGFENKKENAKILVNIFKIEDKLAIEIIDNGVGMDRNKIEEIKNNPNHESIGIPNVLKRIEIFYKGDHEFEILSKKGYWTKVKIILPLSLNWNVVRKE